MRYRPQRRNLAVRGVGGRLVRCFTGQYVFWRVNVLRPARRFQNRLLPLEPAPARLEIHVTRLPDDDLAPGILGRRTNG